MRKVLAKTNCVHDIKKILILLLITTTLLSSMVPPKLVESVGFSFDSEINISNTLGNSVEPQIVVLGSNVYVVWKDQTTDSVGDISFKKSTDSGANFDATVNLSNSIGTTSQTPQIASSGSNVYAVWREGNNISFSRSTNSGGAFDPILILSGGATISQAPQIIASGSNVYVIWQEDDDISFRKSTDSGANFDATVNLSNSIGTTSQTPQIASSGSNVYAVWREGNDIMFVRSTDNGNNFDPIISLDGNSATVSQLPQIAVSGSNVYVVWKEGSDIFFKKSIDSGANFVSSVDLGNTGGSSAPDPQVAASGSSVYAVWREDISAAGDIKFRRSTDSGANFDAEANLSSNSGSSIKPQLAVAGNNVFVVWRDDTTTDSTRDIFFKPSDDNGATFGGFTKLRDNGGLFSDVPQIDAAGNSAYIVWRDATTTSSTDGEIKFKKGTISTIDVTFNAAQYKLSQTAEVTVTDSGSSGSVLINVKSSSDTSGIPLTLTETGSGTGIFTGTLTFTTGSSSGTILKAAAGDTITATFGSNTGTASIFPITVDFSGITSFDRGAIANVRVTDQNSNILAGTAETISVTVTSDADPTGISLTLTETGGADTGIFGGSGDTDLIFMVGNDLFPTSGTVAVTQEALAANVTTSIDTTTVGVTSTSDSTGISLTVTETGPKTGIFTGTLTLTTDDSDSPTGKIQVVGGDFVSITHGGLTTRALVIPNPDPSNGAIQVNVPSDTVVATYNGVTGSASVINAAGESGGGGGGLVRPGLVLDLLAGLGGGSDRSPPLLVFNKPKSLTESLFGGTVHDPFKPISPSSDQSTNYPITINGYGYQIEGYSSTLEPYVAKINEPVEFKFVFYDSSKLKHVSLNFANGEEFSDIFPTVTFDDGKISTLDPDGLFADDIQFTMSKDGTKNTLVFVINFKEPSELNLIVRAWDENKNSADTKIFDAIKVVESKETTTVETKENLPGPITTKSLEKPLPDEGLVTLMTSIEAWGGYSSESISDNQLLADVGIDANHIPLWFKETSRWVVHGDTSIHEFVDAVKYLYDKGIIK